MTDFEKMIFDELGLRDGDKITCRIDGNFYSKALFRIGKDNRIYIEQDSINGTSLVNGLLTHIQYKYSYVCDYFKSSKSFTNDVTKVTLIENPITKFLENDIYPVSIPMRTISGIKFNTIITIPNTDVIISDCSGDTYEQSITIIYAKYNNYLNANGKEINKR